MRTLETMCLLTLVLLVGTSANRAAPCEVTARQPDLELVTILRGRYHVLYAPFQSDLGMRIMPEKEHDFHYEIVLRDRNGNRPPDDFASQVGTLEDSMQLHLLTEAITRFREVDRSGALAAAPTVPISMTRIQPPHEAVWAAWTVRPLFETMPEPLSGVLATFSIATDPLKAYIPVTVTSDAIAAVDAERLVIAPAGSLNEQLLRELSDLMMAEEAANWGSLLEHSDAIIALDSNAVIGHAFRARALSELGKQAKAERAMATAEALLTSGADRRLAASVAAWPNRKIVETFMARALCPVRARVVPLTEPAPACSRGAWLSLGW